MYFFTANAANYAGSKPSVKIKDFAASPYTGEAFAAAGLLMHSLLGTTRTAPGFRFTIKIILSALKNISEHFSPRAE